MNNDEFIIAGLKHYPAAMRAVRHFENSMQEKVQDIIKTAISGRPTSDYWKPIGKNIKMRLETSGVDDDFWTCYYVQGKLKSSKPATLESGIWWVKSKALAYAGFDESSPDWIRFGLKLPKGTTMHIEEGVSNYFAIPVKTAREIESGLRLVIAKLLDIAKK
jgi:hypothetical protein